MPLINQQQHTTACGAPLEKCMASPPLTHVTREKVYALRGFEGDCGGVDGCWPADPAVCGFFGNPDITNQMDFNFDPSTGAGAEDSKTSTAGWLYDLDNPSTTVHDPTTIFGAQGFNDEGHGGCRNSQPEIRGGHHKLTAVPGCGRAGEVVEAQIVKACDSSRFKGVGYVEFKDEAPVEKAIGLTERKLCGIPIIAQLTEAEKNRQANDEPCHW